MSVVCPTVSGMTSQAHQPGRPRSRRRRGTVALVSVSVLASLVTATTGWPSHGAGVLLGLVAIGVGIVVAVLVARREEQAGTLVAVSVAAALLLRLDVVGAMIGTTVLVRRGQWRRVGWAGTGLATAGALTLWLDSRRPVEEQLWAFYDADQVKAAATWETYLVVGLLIVALPLVVGYVQRQRATARAAAARSSASEEAAAGLRSELGRVEERELLAREIHDTVAHRLSLLSLHAAALERSVDDPEVTELARTLRADAHGSLDEMRDLIAMMRTPGDLAAAQEARRPATLDTLAELVEQSRGASGSPATSAIHLVDPERLARTTARAAQRILQEALTNLRKHGPPGAGSVTVAASPQSGVHVVVRNPRAGRVTEVPGAGRGLQGLHERVTLLGGTLIAGLQGDEFVLDAWLPWQEGDVAGPR